jgi:endo-1,4-beta-D-glucanase Y/4-amino-4-deoxy-L-arabinose transferase-like glycosyltransferase
MLNFFQKNKYSLALVVVTLIVIFSQAYNMFGYPYYENDEGIYMSQAWSVLTQGKLSPYTYWYDHAPAGWFFLAGWIKLTGGFFTFGPSVNSGRALMFVLHLLSAWFIFVIVKKYTENIWASLLSVLLFTVSPLLIYYQRRVLLDNMMVFWVLFSMVILVRTKLPRWQFYLSAGLFGLAVLTKESAVFFYPAILYLISLRYSLKNNKLKILSWLMVSLFVIALYPLYAWSQGELWNSGAVGEKISLWQTLSWQAGRGSGLAFWKEGSEFRLAWRDWLFRDKWFVYIGVIFTLLISWLSFRKKPWRVITLAILAYVFFLLRGKIVLNFYIIPLVPFLSIAGGLVFAWIFGKFKQKSAKTQAIVLVVLSAFFILLGIGNSFEPYQKNETKSQREAIIWVKKNLPADTKMAIDDYAFVDYHHPGFVNDKTFKNAHVFWKIENDNQIKNDIFHNDWFQIRYIIASDTLDNLLKAGQLNLVRKANEHSREIKSWQSEDGPWSYKMSVRQVIGKTSLKKDMAIKNLSKKDPEIGKQLQTSWQSYKEKFIHNYGQVIDPANNITTSEGQSYAMLRALWMDDEETFKGTWQWAKDHFQFRTQDKLFSWKWQGDKLADFNNATDADEDIALALILADKKWSNEEYLLAGQELLTSIWEECVIDINGHYYLLPVNHNIARQWNGYLFNPSYLSPASYRIFAQVDKEHNWEQLATDSYWILEQINALPNNKTKLPANWYVVEDNTGKLLSAREVSGSDADYFGFDAFRTFWRVALDRQWFESQDAQRYLQQAGNFAVDYYRRYKVLPMLIKPDGQVINPKPSIATNAGYLAILLGRNNPDLLDDFYQAQIQAVYNVEGHFWQNPDDYYGNNWAWFATALYNGNLKPYIDKPTKE